MIAQLTHTNLYSTWFNFKSNSKPFIAFFLVAAAIADVVAQPTANRNGGSRESRPAR